MTFGAVTCWLRSSFMGLVASVSTFAFIYLALYVYVISYPIFGEGEANGEQLSNLVNLVGDWGAPLFFLTVTVLLASRSARRAEEAPVLHGTLTGVVAAVASQVIVYFLYPPVEPSELLVYFALGAAGGWVGGVGGRNAFAGREALYRTSRRIAAVRHPQDIAAAIGEHLGGPNVSGVVLCRAVPATGEGPSFEVEASWTPRGKEAWPAEGCLAQETPGLSDLLKRRSVVLRARDLSRPGQEAWERQRINSALLVPLDAPDGARVGLLVVSFANRGRPSWKTVREILTVGTQVALALENMRLMEQDRRATLLAERQRLSHEIHDTLAQGFTSILMNLSAIELASPQAFEGESRIRRYLEGARRTAHENLAEVKRLIRALHPRLLDLHPLHEAVERFVAAWSQEADVRARVDLVGAPRRLDPETEAALFRAMQEALANVRKHAHARGATVTLSYARDQVSLEVLDDGVGFDPARPSGDGTDSFGLRSMRERVAGVGGSVVVESSPNAGTRLWIGLPATARQASGPEASRELDPTRR